ncbi:MAG: cobaltochelatase subunit CobN [Bryobacteraceae bacterium]
MEALRQHLLLCFLLLASACLCDGQTRPLTVFAADSASYVKQLTPAAHRLQSRHPELRFHIRTTEQIQSEAPEALRRLLAEADVISIGRAYGEVARKLLDAMPRQAERKTVFVAYSDAELFRLNRFNAVLPFRTADASEITALADSLAQTRDPQSAVTEWKNRRPDLGPWLDAMRYLAAKGAGNMENLLLQLLSLRDVRYEPRPVAAPPPYFIHHRGEILQSAADLLPRLHPNRPSVAVIDYDTYFHSGDTELLERIVTELESAGFNVIPIIAAWGEPTHRALREFLLDRREALSLTAVVGLQSFLLGGDQAREKVTPLLQEIGVPVFRAIRLLKRSPEEWLHSEDGLPWASVYYQIAMPELQGAIEPILVGAEKENVTDELTGARVPKFVPIPERIARMVRRIRNWHRLQTLASGDKRVALIYYNHPPGKQNIGADYLNVPATILALLDRMKQEGYEIPELPPNVETLTGLLMERGINVANWAPGLQIKLARNTFRLPVPAYNDWFRQLPAIARDEVRSGPIGYIRSLVELAGQTDERSEIHKTLDRFLSGTRTFVETFPGDQSGAIEALDALDVQLRTDLNHGAISPETKRLLGRIRALNLEGISGWGPEPGQILVADGSIAIPGLQFGNVFIGPQPQRGWQADADTLHSSTIISPHHQYLAFYYYLQHVFRADVIVHIGRHSSYEWLPRKQVALADFDFPDIVIGDVPAVYLYTVDGVGEGLQAKRRGLSVIVDHLIPPLKTTELYGSVLELQALVEQFEAQDVPQRKELIASEIRMRIALDHFESDLGDKVAEYDDDKLAHTVGHYLEELKNTFLPYGLHTFGTPWEPHKVELLADSMRKMLPDGSDADSRRFEALIRASFDAEIEAFLTALRGGFIAPGKGNDPIRTPAVLPTGKNFYALDASVMPTPIAYQMAKPLAEEALRLNDPMPEKVAAILWAVETVRDEGTMLSFILHLLGVRPEWDSRGLVKELRLIPPAELQRPRIDPVITTSGLFRDLFAQMLVLLDRSIRMTLAASYHEIAGRHPELEPKLRAALGGESYESGREPLEANYVAKHWVETLLAHPEASGEEAIARIFGPAEGGYGSGINRVIEQAWTWKHRSEVADVYIHRMSHSYSTGAWGMSSPKLYRQLLRGVDLNFHSRSTNLYGVVDNDDYFDYFGGLSLAIERTNEGRVPGNYVLHLADPGRPRIDTLQHFLTREMRTRYFNPEWVKGMMNEGYAGARTISNKFAEFAWGWQVTNPDIIRDWMWDELHAVYFKDKYAIGVTDWLSEKQHAAALVNMGSILMTASNKGFWKGEPETLRHIANTIGELVVRHGPACSSHNCGNRQTIAWAQRWMRPDLRPRFLATMQSAVQGAPLAGGLYSSDGTARPVAASVPGRPGRAVLFDAVIPAGSLFRPDEGEDLLHAVRAAIAHVDLRAAAAAIAIQLLLGIFAWLIRRHMTARPVVESGLVDRPAESSGLH